MLLLVLTVAVMLAVAYAFAREGILTAFTMGFNVLLAGLVAFSVWEPAAGEIERMLDNSFLDDCEDCLCLVLPFCLTLGLLRAITNSVANRYLTLPPLLQQIGAGVLGLWTGYLVAGFLMVAVQTLPFAPGFMGFEHRVLDGPGSGLRRVVPADRVWLALMHKASLGPFSWSEPTPFDPDGSFSLRYYRLRHRSQ